MGRGRGQGNPSGAARRQPAVHDMTQEINNQFQKMARLAVINPSWKMPADADVLGGLQLARRYAMDPTIGQVVLEQGELTSYSDRYLWYRPDLSLLVDPETTVPGMEDAARTLQNTLKKNGKIAIYGDYDPDGTTGTSALRIALLNYTDRDNIYTDYANAQLGFGLTNEFVEQAHAWGADTVVSIDCGSGQSSSVALAQNLGMKVIVVDHHTVEHDNPADHHLNPRLFQETGNTNTGSQLAWKLGYALHEQYGEVPEDYYGKAMYLAGFGCRADMGSVNEPENRAFFHYAVDTYGREQAIPIGIDMLAHEMSDRKATRTITAIDERLVKNEQLHPAMIAGYARQSGLELGMSPAQASKVVSSIEDPVTAAQRFMGDDDAYIFANQALEADPKLSSKYLRARVDDLMLEHPDVAKYAAQVALREITDKQLVQVGKEHSATYADAVAKGEAAYNEYLVELEAKLTEQGKTFSKSKVEKKVYNRYILDSINESINQEVLENPELRQSVLDLLGEDPIMTEKLKKSRIITAMAPEDTHQLARHFLERDEAYKLGKKHLADPEVATSYLKEKLIDNPADFRFHPLFEDLDPKVYQAVNKSMSKQVKEHIAQPEVHAMFADQFLEDPANPGDVATLSACMNLPKRSKLVSANDVGRLIEAETAEEAAPLAKSLADAYSIAQPIKEEMVVEGMEQAEKIKNKDALFVNIAGYENYAGYTGTVASALSRKTDKLALISAYKGTDEHGQKAYKFSIRNEMKTTKKHMIGELIEDEAMRSACEMKITNEYKEVVSKATIGGHPEVVSGSYTEENMQAVRQAFESWVEQKRGKGNGWARRTGTAMPRPKERQVEVERLPMIEHEAKRLSPHSWRENDRNRPLDISMISRVAPPYLGIDGYWHSTMHFEDGAVRPCKVAADELINLPLRPAEFMMRMGSNRLPNYFLNKWFTDPSKSSIERVLLKPSAEAA